MIDDEAANSKLFAFSYGPPTSIAVDLLGFSSSKVAPASSIKPFVFSVPTLLTGSGGQFAGLDVSPYWSLHPDLTYEQYDQMGWVGRVLVRAKLDLGLTNGQANADPSKAQLSGVAIGVSAPLLKSDEVQFARIVGAPGGDPYFTACITGLKSQVAQAQSADLGAALQVIQSSASTNMNLLNRAEHGNLTDVERTDILRLFRLQYPDVQVPTDGSTEQRVEAFDKTVRKQFQALSQAVDTKADANAIVFGVPSGVADCVKGAAVVAATNPNITLAIGARDSGDPGHFRHLSSVGETVWAAWRLPLIVLLSDGSKPDYSADSMSKINRGQVEYLMAGGSLRYDAHSQFVTGDATSPVVTADRFGAWVGLEGYTSWGRLGGQYGYSSIHTSDGSLSKFNQHGWQWLADAALKLGDTGLWVGGTYGTANGTTAKLNDHTFLLTVYFAPPPQSALFGNANSVQSPKQ